MQLPDLKNISTMHLAQVFNNTSATYKFYWFISVLEIYANKQEKQITFNEIITRMIANAWYPIHYFRLSFGLQDKLSDMSFFKWKNGIAGRRDLQLQARPFVHLN